jgi:hypothetical protein
MSDLSFVSFVAAIVAVRAGERAGWTGGADLAALVRDRFRGDGDAHNALAAVPFGRSGGLRNARAD